MALLKLTRKILSSQFARNPISPAAKRLPETESILDPVSQEMIDHSFTKVNAAPPLRIGAMSSSEIGRSGWM
ncbi:hypothetical protein [Salipiger sp.]|uniref:hypothetical protein n=1 Tax=Salipiger sp. TaxID=2078585 RepID=UPI003A97CBC0